MVRDTLAQVVDRLEQLEQLEFERTEHLRKLRSKLDAAEAKSQTLETRRDSLEAHVVALQDDLHRCADDLGSRFEVGGGSLNAQITAQHQSLRDEAAAAAQQPSAEAVLGDLKRRMLQADREYSRTVLGLQDLVVAGSSKKDGVLEEVMELRDQLLTAQHTIDDLRHAKDGQADELQRARAENASLQQQLVSERNAASKAEAELTNLLRMTQAVQAQNKRRMSDAAGLVVALHEERMQDNTYKRSSISQIISPRHDSLVENIARMRSASIRAVSEGEDSLHSLLASLQQEMTITDNDTKAWDRRSLCSLSNEPILPDGLEKAPALVDEDDENLHNRMLAMRRQLLDDESEMRDAEKSLHVQLLDYKRRLAEEQEKYAAAMLAEAHKMQILTSAKDKLEEQRGKDAERIATLLAQLRDLSVRASSHAPLRVCAPLGREPQSQAGLSAAAAFVASSVGRCSRRRSDSGRA